MAKVKELSDEINRLRSQVEKLKNEGVQMVKERDALQMALESSKIQTVELEKKIKEYERLMK